MNAQFSFAGARHAQRGSGCEDACFLTLLDENAIGLGVFDGVSKCAAGALAAQTAAHALETALRMLYVPSVGLTFEQIALKAGFQAACKALIDKANDQALLLEDLGTTMSAAIFDEEYRRLFWAQVGDSGMLALKSTGEVCVVCPPQKGPAGGHQTYTALDTPLWCFGVEEDVVGVIAATDGIFDVLTSPCTVLTPSDDCAPAATEATGLAGTEAAAAAEARAETRLGIGAEAVEAAEEETHASFVIPNDIALALWQLLLETSPDVSLAALEDALSKPSGPFAYVTDDKTLVIACSPQSQAVRNVFVSSGDGTMGKEHICKEGGTHDVLHN